MPEPRTPFRTRRGASGLRAFVPLLAVACAAPGVSPGPPVSRASRGAPTEDAPAAEFLALPARWRDLDPLGFERAIRAWPGSDAGGARLSDADREQLAAALGPDGGEAGEDPGPRAVRAAVLLARSRDPGALEVLLARLELRVLSPARAADAGDVVAAAAVPRFEARDRARARAAERLAALSHGAGAHPDLEVRVEIAASALALGRDEPIPFLLAVLRAGTADEPWPDFERKQTLAWSKTRAAAALAARAGTDARFEADGSFSDQRAEAARLEALLGAAR